MENKEIDLEKYKERILKIWAEYSRLEVLKEEAFF